MNRLLTTATVLGIAGLITGVYQVKYEVRDLDRRASELRQQIARDRQALDVLDAEWAYLTQPARLQALSERHLNLAPPRGEQFVRLSDIPLRPGSVTAASVPPDLQGPESQESRIIAQKVSYSPPTLAELNRELRR